MTEGWAVVLSERAEMEILVNGWDSFLCFSQKCLRKSADRESSGCLQSRDSKEERKLSLSLRIINVET